MGRWYSRNRELASRHLYSHFNATTMSTHLHVPLPMSGVRLTVTILGKIIWCAVAVSYRGTEGDIGVTFTVFSGLLTTITHVVYSRFQWQMHEKRSTVFSKSLCSVYVAFQTLYYCTVRVTAEICCNPCRQTDTYLLGHPRLLTRGVPFVL